LPLLYYEISVNLAEISVDSARFSFCYIVNTDKKKGIKKMNKEGEFFDIPNSNGNVWPEDCCPAYTFREGSIDSIRGCWYCRYADFHLTEERALDVGICKWPRKVLD